MYACVRVWDHVSVSTCVCSCVDTPTSWCTRVLLFSRLWTTFGACNVEMSLACRRTQNVGPSGIHRVTGTAMQLGPGDRTLQGASQEGCCPRNVHCRTRLCCVWARPPLPQGSRLTCPCRGVRGQGIVTPLIRAPASVLEVSGQSPQGPAASKIATGRSP